MWLPLALSLLATPQVGITLPEGPVARAWAGVGEATRPVDLAEELLAGEPWLSDPGETAPGKRWSTWARWVGEEAAAGEADPRRRCGLLLLAREQGRWRDAWSHLERLGGNARWAAAAMPRLLPGVPEGSASGRGGLPGVLPDGVLLRPAPPPMVEGIDLRRAGVRTARIEGLRVGEAVVAFEIGVEASGVEVTLRHCGGGPATLRVLLPEPPGQEIRIEYVDWMRQDEVGRPLLVELDPENAEHELFGRFVPRTDTLPAAPTGSLPRQLALGGLWIECAAGSPAEDEARAAAEALGLLLGVPAGVHRPGSPPPREPWTSTVLRLPGAADEARRFLSAIASATEARLLPRLP